MANVSEQIATIIREEVEIRGMLEDELASMVLDTKLALDERWILSDCQALAEYLYAGETYRINVIGLDALCEALGIKLTVTREATNDTTG